MKIVLILLSMISLKVEAVTVPKQTISLVKQFEGLRLDAYQDSAGYWTQGFGHKNATPPPCTNCSLPITEQQAEGMLQNDLEHILSLIQGHIAVDLTDNQLAAVLSFSFNLGQNAFINSTLLRELNAGNIEAAADQFELWVHAGGETLPGLVARRTAEKMLFLTPDEEVQVASN